MIGEDPPILQTRPEKAPEDPRIELIERAAKALTEAAGCGYFSPGNTRNEMAVVIGHLKIAAERLRQIPHEYKPGTGLRRP